MSLAQEINRVVAPFEVISEFKPAGDQPAAIAELTERIKNGEKDVVLLGATGTGKSATTAWLIEQVQRPTLVMVQNKTLAASSPTNSANCCPTTRWSTSSPTTTTTSQKPTWRRRTPSSRRIPPLTRRLNGSGTPPPT